MKITQEEVDGLIADVLSGMSVEEAMTRRGFLKTTAGIGAAALIAGSGTHAFATGDPMSRPGMGGRAEPDQTSQVVKSVINTGEKALRTGSLDLPGARIRLPRGVRRAGQQAREAERVYKQVTGPWRDRFPGVLGGGSSRPRVNPAWKPATPGAQHEGVVSGSPAPSPTSTSGAGTGTTSTSSAAGKSSASGGGSGSTSWKSVVVNPSAGLGTKPETRNGITTTWTNMTPPVGSPQSGVGKPTPRSQDPVSGGAPNASGRVTRPGVLFPSSTGGGAGGGGSGG